MPETTPETYPCYFVFQARDSDIQFSLKCNPDDELIIYSLCKYRVFPIGVKPGRYIIVYKVGRKEGFLTVNIKEHDFITVVIPPYGR